jgi:hypothetical protein
MQAHSGVLPEDRADALYFRYDGGGVVINGPSVLLRKSIGEHVSVSANHYVDMVSSASIDVETSASPYEDERTQSSLSVDFLNGKSMYTLGYVNSDESDYQAKTMFAAISHDMFGDLTTVAFGYKKGENEVFKNLKDASGVIANDPNFAETMDSQSFNVSVSQIITKNLILAGQYEVITDEGFLRSPVSLDPLLHRPAEPGAGARAVSEHALEQCGFVPREVLPAVPRRHRHDVPVLHRHLGRSRPHRRARLRASDEQRKVDFRSTRALLHAGSRRLLPGHLSARRLRQLHGARQRARDLQRHHRRPGRHL